MFPPPARRRKVSDGELLAAVPHALHLADLLRRLGMAPCGGNYECTRTRLLGLGVDESRFRAGRQVRPVDPQELAAAVSSATSWAMAARLVGLPSSGARRVRLLAARAGLDTSPLSPSGERVRGVPAAPLDTVLVRGRRCSTSKLRERLLREGVLAHRCAGCGGERWQERPIPLELDHINGDRTDNRLENLRLLCPDCHAQTDTYRGRNIGAPRAAAPAEPAAPVPDRAATARRRLLLVMAPRTS